MNTIKIFLWALFAVLVCNSTFIIIAHLTDVDRFYLNFDYFLPLLFLYFRRLYLFIFSFLIFAFLDFISLFVQVFPFIRVTDVLYLLKFTLISSTTYQFVGVLIIGLIVVQLWILQKIVTKSLKVPLLIIFNLCMIFSLVQDYFIQERNQITFKRPHNGDWIGSGWMVYANFTDTLFAENFNFSDESLSFQKLDHASHMLKNVKHNKVLYVINESWGFPYNASIQKEIISSILKHPLVKYDETALSHVKYSGFTVGAELRELCQATPMNYNLKNQMKGFENCLPHTFKKMGFQTTAVHGALGLMYDRKDWYPRAGFQMTLFRDQGLNLPDSRCYSFPGNCDRDIAPRVIQQFEKHDKLFLYWLTLNTHAIYDKRDLKDDQFDCQAFGIHENTQSCRNLKLQKQFFNTLADMLSSPALKGTKVMVVGDHEPPIIEKEKSIFMPSKVPVLEFEVKH